MDLYDTAVTVERTMKEKNDISMKSTKSREREISEKLPPSRSV